MTKNEIENFAESLEVPLPENWSWYDLLPVIDAFIKHKDAYFLYKMDGLRVKDKHTFVLSITPSDQVVRIDTDSIGEGFQYIFSRIKELSETDN